MHSRFDRPALFHLKKNKKKQIATTWMIFIIRNDDPIAKSTVKDCIQIYIVVDYFNHFFDTNNFSSFVGSISHLLMII